MTTYLVVRNNQTKMVLNDPTIKSNGDVWFKGSPLVDGECEAFKATGRAAITEILKAKDFGKLPAGIIAKIGTNPSGLRVVKQSEYLAEQEAKITPAQKMRREINDLYYRAHKLAESDSEDNVSGPMMLRGKADKMLSEWQAMYPAEAAQERKDALMSKAQDLRDKASGALTYDADGLIGPEEQQKKHDDFINQAKAIEAQAANIKI
jgi:hypothetical protein